MFKTIPKGTLPHVHAMRDSERVAFNALLSARHGSLEYRIAKRRQETLHAALLVSMRAEADAYRTHRFTYQVVRFVKTHPARGAANRAAITEMTHD